MINMTLQGQRAPNKALQLTVNLPRKSRHLDLTEEVSGAEARTEEDQSI